MELIGKYCIDYSEWWNIVNKSPQFILDKDELTIKMNFDIYFKRYKKNLSKKYNYGIHYFPTVNAILALYIYQNLLEKKSTSFEFMKASKWFLDYDNYIEHENSIFYTNKFPYPMYNLEINWTNGMTQGLILSVLTRVYKITGEEIYLDLIKKIVRSFFDDKSKYSFTRYYDDMNKVWFEEYPSRPSSFVLNGNLFAIFGLVDYLKVIEDKEVEDLLKKALFSVNDDIMIYRIGNWSYYDRIKKIISTDSYHDLHIAQLNEIISICSKFKIECPNIRKVSNIWKKNRNLKITKVYLLFYLIPSRLRQGLRYLKFLFKDVNK